MGWVLTRITEVEAHCHLAYIGKGDDYVMGELLGHGISKLEVLSKQFRFGSLLCLPGFG